MDKMREVMEGPFIMRHVMNNVEEAEAKGEQSREDMIRRFSPEIVANIVTNHIQDILLKTS